MGLECCSPTGAGVFSGVNVDPYFAYAATAGNSFVQWDSNGSDFYDTDNYFDPADRTKLTAPFDGRYLLAGMLEFNATTTGLIVTPTRSDGYFSNRFVTPASLGGITAVSIPLLLAVTLNAGQYMRIQVNNLGAFTVGHSSSFTLSMTLLGKL